MAFNIQFISHPSEGVLQILAQRIGAAFKNQLEIIDTSAVGLVQGKLVDMIAAADVAEKAAQVRVYDLKGTCPQHLTMIGVFGSVAAVKAALEAIEGDEGLS